MLLYVPINLYFLAGYSSPYVHEERINEIFNDVKRIEFHSKYLASLAKSIRFASLAESVVEGHKWNFFMLKGAFLLSNNNAKLAKPSKVGPVGTNE